MTLCSISKISRACVTAAFLVALAGTSLASDNAVLARGDQFSVSAADIEADTLRMPPEMRDPVLAKPSSVAQIASNLYVRRGMARQAEAAGMNTDPIVAAAVRVARDKALSDAWINKLEKDSVADQAAIASAARESFNASKADAFRLPEQLHLRHILVSGSDAEALARAAKILADLKTGADFAQVAREQSADKGSGARGGDLGMVSRGRMVPEFEEAAFTLQKPNELSGVVQTKFGFHIVQLLERQPARARTFEEVKPELVSGIRKKLEERARLSAAEGLQSDMKLDTAAIDAFSTLHAK